MAPLLLLAALLAALAATVAACGESPTTKAAAPTTTHTPDTTAAPGGQGWERVVPAGDCQCSDGSEFSFWVRKANPKKVLFYFQEGGACFSAEMCDAKSGVYRTTVDDGPPGPTGVFDFAVAHNPVRRLLHCLRPLLHG